MKNKDIYKIFDKLGIEIKKIDKATNSFNSNVYIVEGKKEKYVLKITNSEKKRLVESKYMDYLSNYIQTAKLISNGELNGKNYIVMTFFNGKNIFDEDAINLSDRELKNIGVVLGKLHSVPLIDDENDSWYIYLKDCLEKVQGVLKDVLKDENTIIYNYLKNYIENKLKDNYKNAILHMDFRVGNLIFRDNDVGIIDMESMKNGEYVFDFVKTSRILPKNKFNIILDGYKSIRDIDINFFEKLDFYVLFDSYTSLWWSLSKNKTNSDFYKMNYIIVQKYLNEMINQ